MRNDQGVIFDIQHFSVHDGPGVRSTVFLKGCPLSCHWCSNPESQSGAPQVMFFRHLCSSCGACVEVCPEGASVLRESAVVFDCNHCSVCGACVSACPRGARTLSGRMVGVDEICDEVGQHWRIFMQSGGGVTCGGGEALMQPRFLHALLEELHDNMGFHTCLDTSGFAPWETLQTMLPHLDLILLDIKQVDDAVHRRATGRSNAPILHNAQQLGKVGFPVIVRLPLIPGVNDDTESLQALGRFLCEAGLNALEILPYHEYGRSKYEALGRVIVSHPRECQNLPVAEAMLRDFGLDVQVQKP